MRPSTVDLLRIRDGEPVDASIRALVEGSPSLRAELDALARTRRALRDLPTLTPPPGRWQRIADALAARPDSTPSTRRLPAPGRWPLGAAIAASVALAAVWLVGRGPGSAAPEATAPATIVADDAVPAQPLLATPAFASLVEESARLERVLDGLRGQPRVVRVGTAATIAGLEDRIAWIDDRLMFARSLGLGPAERQALYRQRVELLNALVQVRYADARRFSF
jgi:hypothetical protein